MADNQVDTVETQTQTQTNPVETQETNQQPLEPIRTPEIVEAEEISEESETEEEEQEVVHTGPHLNPVRYDHMATQYLQSFSLQALLFLQVVWTLFSRALTVTQTVSTGVVRSLQTQMYVFFQGSTYPYRVQDYSIAGPGVAPVEWYYNADTKVFLSANLYNTSNEYQTHHFPWLSGEIQYNDLTLYDVSEFLQEIRWAGASRPSSALVLSAWSLSSGIVLNIKEGLVLKVIHEDGAENVLSVRV